MRKILTFAIWAKTDVVHTIGWTGTTSRVGRSNENRVVCVGLDVLLQILGTLEGFSAEVTLVGLQGNVDPDVRSDVVTLDGRGAAVGPAAGEIQIVGTLSTDVTLADVFLYELDWGAEAAVTVETHVKGFWSGKSLTAISPLADQALGRNSASGRIGRVLSHVDWHGHRSGSGSHSLLSIGGGQGLLDRNLRGGNLRSTSRLLRLVLRTFSGSGSGTRNRTRGLRLNWRSLLGNGLSRVLGGLLDRLLDRLRRDGLLGDVGGLLRSGLGSRLGSGLRSCHRRSVFVLADHSVKPSGDLADSVSTNEIKIVNLVGEPDVSQFHIREGVQDQDQVQVHFGE